MSEITALRTKDITPEMVLSNIMGENLKHIYAVTIDEHGELTVWASGDLSRMSDAALVMLSRATSVALGKVE